jgi:hypothetical protein
MHDVDVLLNISKRLACKGELFLIPPHSQR